MPLLGNQIAFIRNCFAAVALLCFFAASFSVARAKSTKDYADIVITSAKIFTVDPHKPWAQAVAIKGDKISFVGTDKQAQRLIGPNTIHYSANGKLVIPGLVDAHTHPGSTSAMPDRLKLPDTTNVDELVQAVAKYAQQHPDLKVLQGGEWKVTAFGPKGPDKALLDKVVTDRPVILYDDSGHSQWLNSRALELMGITRETADPRPGVSYFVRDANGEPTGWAKEGAVRPFIGKLKIPSGITEENLKKYLDYLSSMGVTTLYDAAENEEALAIVAKLDREGRLPVRYFGGSTILLPKQLPNAINEFKRLKALYEGNRLKFTTIKLFLDGVNELGTSYLLEPFANDPSSRGHPVVDGDTLRAFLKELNNEHIDLHIHTVGDGAVHLALDTVESVQKEVGPLNSRVTLAHIELASDADMRRFKELGVVANHTPHWDGGLYTGADKYLGPKRYGLMYRIQPILDTGAVVAFSSDTTTKEEWDEGRVDPYVGMQIAHNRQDIAGGAKAPIRSKERLALEDLVRGYTMGGAYQLRLDDRIGSITPGKSADLVVLDRDMFKADRYEIHETKPVATFMEGKLTHGALKAE